MFYSLLYPQHSALCLIVVQSIGHVQFFATPWTAACQASLSFAISYSLLKLMSIELVMLFLWTNRLAIWSLVPLFGAHVHSLSRVQLFVTPWTVAHQSSLSMGFPRQECWSGLPFPSPGDLPDPGIKPAFSALAGDSWPVSHLGSPPLPYLVLSMKKKNVAWSFQ